MVLDGIVGVKREELALQRASGSLESLLSRCRRSRRDFRRAVATGSPAFILELKLASPSAGPILPRGRQAGILGAYAGHADAVSVVTDRRFFGGSPGLLEEAARATPAPVLCKDFVLDPLQVAVARLHGADAILLILAILDDEGWRRCAGTARRLGMDVLTEVHDEREARRAVELGAEIVGINSRDLRSFTVDTGLVARLAPLLPAGSLVVAESGIGSRDDLAGLRPHADAFLVGTALLRSPDPEMAVREMVYGTTKICGLTRPGDARAAWKAGATHAGLVLASGSPRTLRQEAARVVRDAAPLRWVGVFVNEPPAAVGQAAGDLDLDGVQLHGEMTREAVAATRAALPSGCALWRAVGVGDRLPDLESALENVDRILLDALVPGRNGGAGRAFDWSLLPDPPLRSRVILAGGLNPGNASRAAATGVAGLDVSSGVERAPGRKDAVLVDRFLKARRRIPGRGDPVP